MCFATVSDAELDHIICRSSDDAVECVHMIFGGCIDEKFISNLFAQQVKPHQLSIIHSQSVVSTYIWMFRTSLELVSKYCVVTVYAKTLQNSSKYIICFSTFGKDFECWQYICIHLCTFDFIHPAVATRAWGLPWYKAISHNLSYYEDEDE